VALCHDLFNYFMVLVLLPLELMTGFLRRSAVALATLVEGVGGSPTRVRSGPRSAAAWPIQTIDDYDEDETPEAER
jgi:hypothetical protein